MHVRSLLFGLAPDADVTVVVREQLKLPSLHAQNLDALLHDVLIENANVWPKRLNNRLDCLTRAPVIPEEPRHITRQRVQVSSRWIAGSEAVCHRMRGRAPQRVTPAAWMHCAPKGVRGSDMGPREKKVQR